MELERVVQMEESIVENLNDLLEKRILRIVDNYQKENEANKNIPDILRALIYSREGSLIIGFLRSSIVSESYAFYFGFYEDELFVEENPDYIILKLPIFFEGVEEDIIEIEKLLRRKFIRVFSSEIEEIRRHYMIKIFEKCEVLFKYILEEDKIGKKEGIQVFYGEYMGEKVTQIGIV